MPYKLRLAMTWLAHKAHVPAEGFCFSRFLIMVIKLELTHRRFEDILQTHSHSRYVGHEANQ